MAVESSVAKWSAGRYAMRRQDQTRERRNITTRAPVAEDRRSSCRRQYPDAMSKRRNLLLRDSRDLIRRLLRDGFERTGTRGSHHKFVHPVTHRSVIVPHPKRDLPIGTVKSIYRQAGWPTDDGD
jgi:predicted RNA binding protein YcfA (HicA-like mRNA interferase family)